MGMRLVFDRDAIAVVCRARGVSRLQLFGSATGAAFEEETNDVDFFVDFDARTLLWDVQKAGSRIGSFISGLTAESYAAAELHRSAVERQLLVIGGALSVLRRVDPDTAVRIPDVSRIIGLRNVSRTRLRRRR